MLHVLRQEGRWSIGGLLTTTNEVAERVSMHGVRRALLFRQARAADLPLIEVPLPFPCSNTDYEARMAKAVAGAVAEGFTHVAFGDLFLEDVRQYREARLAGTGLDPLFPLWQRPTAALSRTLVAEGLRAKLTCLDPRHLDRGFAGADYDTALLDRLPADVDPCGERGEFHTFAYDGPMFGARIDVTVGAIVERDGFVFADLQPGSTGG